MQRTSLKSIVRLLSPVVFVIVALIIFTNFVDYPELIPPETSYTNFPVTLTSATGIKITFDVELADTQYERSVGLMYRDKLEESSGMLFILPSDTKSSFWMKNVEFPLDIIFINSESEIVSISPNSQPCVTEVCEQYSSEYPYRYVLEVNGGLIERYKIGVGDLVELPALP